MTDSDKVQAMLPVLKAVLTDLTDTERPPSDDPMRESERAIDAFFIAHPDWQEW